MGTAIGALQKTDGTNETTARVTELLPIAAAGLAVGFLASGPAAMGKGVGGAIAGALVLGGVAIGASAALAIGAHLGRELRNG